MCKWVVRVFWVIYILALFILAVGTFGLFGQPKDSLAGIFVIPLGLPWNLLLAWLPEPVKPWLAAGAPLVNIALISWFCRKRAAR